MSAATSTERNRAALATIRRLGSARTAAYAGLLDPAEPGDLLAALIAAAWTPNGGAA